MTPHRTPTKPHLLRLFADYGWAIVLVALLIALAWMTGCDDLQTYAADQASLADAIAQAAQLTTEE